MSFGNIVKVIQYAFAMCINYQRLFGLTIQNWFVNIYQTTQIYQFDADPTNIFFGGGWLEILSIFYTINKIDSVFIQKWII